MIIGVVCCGHVGGAKLAGKEGLAYEICVSALAGVAANRTIPFMKKVFIVGPRTERLAREFFFKLKT